MSVPRETTKSIAILVYPSGLSRDLPDECPSSRYNKLNITKYLNFSHSLQNGKIL